MDIGARWLFFPANEEEKYEARKFMLLALAYFFVIATYTLVKVLKDTLFIDIVGKEYIPWAKLFAMVALVPAVLFYSYLVDNLRRYQLLLVYSLVYGVSLMASMILVAHPDVGITNTATSPYRLFGWFFYFLIEGYYPFVVSVFWAYLNSVNDPKSATKNYSSLIAVSKVGGMVGAAVGMSVFTLPVYFNLSLSHVVNHQILLGASAFFVLGVPAIMHALMRAVPGRYLHGYEAAYQFEKKRKEAGQEPRILDGLKMFIKYPYIFGIFGMVFFYEVIYTMLNFMRLGITKEASQHISDVTYSLFWQDFLMQATGFCISFLGTRMLVRNLGERRCLMLVPASALVLVLVLMFNYTPGTVVAIVIVIRAINYAFALPLREALYIPTIKDVKFKSKSWIDAFGSKFSKSIGSLLHFISQMGGAALFFPLSMAIFCGITVLWGLVAMFIGNKYVRVIARNEVVGDKEELLA